jgi:hypothetical protein
VTDAADDGSGAFCTAYTGWHYHSDPGFFINGKQIKYAFVGNPDGCSASGVPGPSPNNNPAADSMASVFAHELAEAATNPLGGAFGGPGGEVADMCGSFGSTYTVANGAKANMKLGGKDYLIQQVFDPSTFQCAFSH